MSGSVEDRLAAVEHALRELTDMVGRLVQIAIEADEPTLEQQHEAFLARIEAAKGER